GDRPLQLAQVLRAAGREHRLAHLGAQVRPHHALARGGEQQHAQAVLDAGLSDGVGKPSRLVGQDREPPAGAEERLAHDAFTFFASTDGGGGVGGRVTPPGAGCVCWTKACSNALASTTGSVEPPPRSMLSDLTVTVLASRVISPLSLSTTFAPFAVLIVISFALSSKRIWWPALVRMIFWSRSLSCAVGGFF